jgi:hypothetical protein
MQDTIIKLKNIVWEVDREDLPKELELVIDQEHLDCMVEEGLDGEEIFDQMLYDDLKEEYGVEVIEWEIEWPIKG